MIDIAGLKKNVALLNWAAAAVVSALVGLFFITTNQIDARFDKVDEPLDEISAGVAAQTATLNGMDRRLTRLEDSSEPVAKASN